MRMRTDHLSMACPHCKGSGKVMDPRRVGDALRAKRESKGFSLRRIADCMGISSVYLSDLERGRRDWNDTMLERYEQALANARQAALAPVEA